MNYRDRQLEQRMAELAYIDALATMACDRDLARMFLTTGQLVAAAIAQAATDAAIARAKGPR
jgi:hypothetical protein